MPPLLDFTDRVVVITGAAAGIGAATTARFLDAGAQVIAVDVAQVSSDVTAAHRCDLGDPDAIDRLLGFLPNAVDVLVNCAGVPNGGRFGPAEVMAVNWLGLRHLTEAVLGRMPTGSSVVHVASTAGRGWADRRHVLDDLFAATTFGDGATWVAAHPEEVGDGYVLSKEAVQYFTLTRALETVRAGVRMNSICPGVTNTQIAPDFRRGMGDEVLDRALEVTGRVAEPDEMAPAILFLADEASSSYINGLNLDIDRGSGAARRTARA